MITKETVKANEQITTYIRKADEALEALGYTEHSFAHVTRAASFAEHLLLVCQMKIHIPLTPFLVGADFNYLE